MAEYRKVATKVWSDPWVFQLKPEHKLIWLWLITNAHANAAGIYQIPTAFVAFETGVDIGEVETALRSFHEAGKVMWDAETATIWVKKMRLYQASASPKLRAAMERDLAQIPDGPVKRAYLAFYEGAEDKEDKEDRESKVAPLAAEEVEELASAAEAEQTDNSEKDAAEYGMDRVLAGREYGIDRVSIGYQTLAPEQEQEQEQLQLQPQPPRARAGGDKGDEKLVSDADTGIGEVYAVWEQNVGPITPMIADALEDLAQDHSPQWVEKAIQEAVLSGGRSVKYVRAILRRWRRDGYGTPRPSPPPAVVKATISGFDEVH